MILIGINLYVLFIAIINYVCVALLYFGMCSQLKLIFFTLLKVLVKNLAHPNDQCMQYMFIHARERGEGG